MEGFIQLGGTVALLLVGYLVGHRLEQQHFRSLREREILVAPCATDLVRFLPPLVVEKEQIGEVVDVFDEILRQG